MNRLLAASLVVLFLGVSFIGCQPDATELPVEAAEAIVLFSPNAHVVGRADLEQLESGRALPFVDESDRAKLSEMLEELRLTPESALPTIYLAMEEPLNAGRHLPSSIVVKTEIDEERLEDFLNEHLEGTYSTTSQGAFTVYAIGGESGEEELFVTILDENTLIAAPSAEALTAMIERFRGEATGFGQDAISAELLATVNHDASAWILVRNAPTLPFTNAYTDDETSERIARVVRDVTLSIDLEEEQIGAQLVLTTDAEAQDLASVIRGALSLAQSTGDQQEAHRDLLDHINVVERSGRVIITAEAAHSTLESLASHHRADHTP